MSIKKRVRVYPGSKVFGTSGSLNIISFLKQVDVFRRAEKLAKLVAATLSMSFALSLVFGLIFAELYFSDFGIPYIEIANVEDYVRAAISKLNIITLSLISVFILILFLRNFSFLEFKKVFILKGVHPVAVIFRVLYFLIFSFLIVMLVAQFTDLKEIYPFKKIIPKPRPWESEIIEYRNTIWGVKSGQNGILSIEYGKDLKEVNCLAFITEAGGQTHFWSIQNDALLSIRNEQLVSTRVLLPSVPEPTDEKRRRYKSESEFFDSNYGKELLAWIKKKKAICK